MEKDRKFIKVCDFGTMRDATIPQDPTKYLVSRFYRAPDIILGMKVTSAVDMWSIGCTLYELWTGQILFTGRDNNQVLLSMLECLGWPSEKYLKKGSTADEFFNWFPHFSFVSKELDPFGKVSASSFLSIQLTLCSTLFAQSILPTNPHGTSRLWCSNLQRRFRMSTKIGRAHV